jgi:thiamine-phosphate pyrophosphorylase
MLITDWGVPDLLGKVGDALAGVHGAPVAVQHRHPGVSDRQFLEEARALAQVCGHFTGVHLFVNRRLDVALLVDAHLHLPATGLRVAEARALLRGKLVSCAVHAPSEVQPEADLSLVSPVYPPGSKRNDLRAPLGVEGFRALAQATGGPAFALGGLSAERVKTLKPAGVAVISEVLKAPSPRAALRELLRSF